MSNDVAVTRAKSDLRRATGHTSPSGLIRLQLVAAAPVYRHKLENPEARRPDLELIEPGQAKLSAGLSTLGNTGRLVG